LIIINLDNDEGVLLVFTNKDWVTT